MRSSMSITRRDREGARAKLAKAGLTERQLNALEDMILRDAVTWAESIACSRDGKTTHRLGSLGSLLSFAGARHARESIRVAVYWYHEPKRIELAEERQYDTFEYPSTWRPQA